MWQTAAGMSTLCGWRCLHLGSHWTSLQLGILWYILVCSLVSCTLHYWPVSPILILLSRWNFQGLLEPSTGRVISDGVNLFNKFILKSRINGSYHWYLNGLSACSLSVAWAYSSVVHQLSPGTCLPWGHSRQVALTPPLHHWLFLAELAVANSYLLVWYFPLIHQQDKGHSGVEAIEVE